MKVQVTTESREEEVKANIRRKFAQGLADCENIILSAAQTLASPHKRSGRYMRSLGYALNEQTLEGALYSGGKVAPHAHLVEWGSHKMAPQGVMRKAAEQTREKMGQAIAKRCKEPV